jgi:hypothetical protein
MTARATPVLNLVNDGFVIEDNYPVANDGGIEGSY